MLALLYIVAAMPVAAPAIAEMALYEETGLYELRASAPRTADFTDVGEPLSVPALPEQTYLIVWIHVTTVRPLSPDVARVYSLIDTDDTGPPDHRNGGARGVRDTGREELRDLLESGRTMPESA